MASKKILVVDDEVGIRELLQDILQDEGFHVQLAKNAAAAREARLKEQPDIVLLDIWMPDCDGITLLKEWGNGGLLTMPVIMMSGHGTIDTAVEATRIGAFDFLEKPIALQKLLKTVGAALKQSEQHPSSALSLVTLGKSPIVLEVKERLEKIAHANNENALLLIGPQGACGELCARYLHKTNTPWLRLIERNKLATAPIELLQTLEDGVLYIPEVSELSKIEQKGLLLLINKANSMNVHVVCNTSDNLPQLQQEGAFENSLLQVLSGTSIRIPALDEHKEDIPDLAIAIANMQFSTLGAEYKDFDIAALNALRNANWPGDFVQLDAAVRNLIKTSLGEKITLNDVKRIFSQYDQSNDSGTSGANKSTTSTGAHSNVEMPDLQQPLREARDAFERMYFQYHLKETTNNMSKLAEIAGLERTQLYRKLKQLGISLKG
jgi:DNA-binding NtrC family response regulator